MITFLRTNIDIRFTKLYLVSILYYEVELETVYKDTDRIPTIAGTDLK